MAAEEETLETVVKTEQILVPLPYGTRGMGSKFDVQDPDKKGKYPLRMGYGSKNLVWIRDLEKPLSGFSYEGHVGSGDVKAFAFHPRAGWGLSGDDRGKGQVWTIRKVEPIVKNEVQNGKAINDVCWSPDGKRIGFAGAGEEETGKVTPWDNNNQNGIFQSPGQPYLCIDYRPIRPFNLCISGEGKINQFWKGPPFKKLLREDMPHKKFVNDCKYSRDGKYLITVSSDKQISLYFAKTCELLRTWGKKFKGAHTSSIYGCSWGPKSNRFATAAADKTVKIWGLPDNDEDKGTGEISVIATIPIGEQDICDMQSYICWHGDVIYSTSQNGDITIIDADVETDQYTIRETITGHKATIHGLALVPNTEISISSCSDGKFVRTNWENGATHLLRGTGHGQKSHAKMLYITPDGSGLYSGGSNDTVLYTDLSGDRLGEDLHKVEGSIRFLCGTEGIGNLALVGTSRNHLYVMDGVNVVTDLVVEHTIQRADVVTQKNGDVKLYVPHDEKVEVYKVSEAGELEHEKTIDLDSGKKDAKRVKCKPEGTHIAIIRGNDAVQFYNTKTGEKEQAGAFQKHLGQCRDITWFRDGEKTHGKVITVSADLAIKVYTDVFTTLQAKEEHHAAAHALTNCVALPDGDHFLVSTGDGSIRKYSLRV